MENLWFYNASYEMPIQLLVNNVFSIINITKSKIKFNHPFRFYAIPVYILIYSYTSFFYNGCVMCIGCIKYIVNRKQYDTVRLLLYDVLFM